MEFTGERYLPNVDGQIKYEHLHRYALCLEFVEGKRVLDIASGEGYGSALLAKIAQSVVGVDISQEAVDYAEKEYSSYQNLKFLIGSCDSVPLEDCSIDVVTSFETIEHHDKHKEMMQEIKRVLKPDGVLIISSPNRLTYSDEPNYSNPFHVKELYYDELVKLLNACFKHIQVYGQKIATGSFVFPLQEIEETAFKAYTGNIEKLSRQVCSLDSPIYFIAVCSDEADKIQSPINSIYIDKDDDLLKNVQSVWHHQLEKTQQISQVQLQDIQTKLEQSQLQVQHSQLNIDQLKHQQKQTEQELNQSKSQLQQTQTELKNSQSEIDSKEIELNQSKSQLQQTQTELKNSQSEIDSKEIELKELNSQLQQTKEELIVIQQKLKILENSIFFKLKKIWFGFKHTRSLKDK